MAPSAHSDAAWLTWRLVHAWISLVNGPDPNLHDRVRDRARVMTASSGLREKGPQSVAGGSKKKEHPEPQESGICACVRW